MEIAKRAVLVTGILRNKKGEILLLKRSRKNKTFVNFWHLLEGKIEVKEQPIEALEREIKEEIGCKLTSAKIITAQTTIATWKGVNYWIVRIVFDVQWKGKIVLSDEHSAYRWVSISKALELNRLADGIEEVLLEVRRCHKR